MIGIGNHFTRMSHLNKPLRSQQDSSSAQQSCRRFSHTSSSRVWLSYNLKNLPMFTAHPFYQFPWYLSDSHSFQTNTVSGWGELLCIGSRIVQESSLVQSGAGYGLTMAVQEPGSLGSNPTFCQLSTFRGSMTFLSASCPVYAACNGGNENGKDKIVIRNT